MGRVYPFVGLLLGASLWSCAKTPVHTDRSESAIRAAEEVGAPTVPDAALYLQLAKEETQKAKELAGGGDKDQAQSLLLRAEADADLAIIIAHEQAQKDEAQEAMKRVRDLESQNH